MDYNSATKPRFKEMRPSADGKLMAEWQLTDTKLLDTVKLTLPPTHVIPVIFVPGIMGSNLCNMNNEPVWLLNSIRGKPLRLAWNWLSRRAGDRQTILHPKRTIVYKDGAVPKDDVALGMKGKDLIGRGWGEVSEASYHAFLIWLNEKLNASSNPLAWDDFSQGCAESPQDGMARWSKTLQPGLEMTMRGVPEFAESDIKVNAITSDELLKRSKSSYPIYAFGYNWLDTNETASELLKERIQKIIGENNIGPMKCTQVILVTHSMGGLVARACSQLPGMENKIVGIVHGVMPATGAAVAYRRCKVGMWDEDRAAAVVIGVDGQEVTAVFAQSPGALQLLPSEDYGKNWLKIVDPSGQIVSSFPKNDPYDEIYLLRDRWWSLIREEWLSPLNGKPIKWGEFSKNIKHARDFHRSLTGKYHHRTFCFYGGGSKKDSFQNVVWSIKRGNLSAHKGPLASPKGVILLDPKEMRTDGSSSMYVGGERTLETATHGITPVAYHQETSSWEVHCAQRNSPGDGTVPTVSGRDPRKRGGSSILQQFELPGVEHESAFRDFPSAQSVSYYAITKLAALADRS